MTTTSAGAAIVAAPSRPARESLGHRWLTGWGHLAYVVSGVVTGAVGIALASLVLTGALALLGGGAGLVVLIPSLLGAQGLAVLSRARVLGLTGTEIVPPRRDRSHPLWRRLLLDREKWHAAAFYGLHGLWATAAGAVFTLLVGQALVLALGPVLQLFRSPHSVPVFWWHPLTTPALIWPLAAAGLAVVLAAPFLARGLAAVDIALARWLLGDSPERRIAELTETRREAVDSVEAERRRIERDLHDGPQQRLVSIAMDLGMARDALRHSPDAVADLLDHAHASSKEAITEMRHVARGIAPPILTDRGLDAALSALAARSPVPVAVTVAVPDRLDPTTEAIAYFVVSEALTNVAKHARATAARVEVLRWDASTATRPRLDVTVSDDGVGGADAARGTGLSGLRQRVASVDGELQVHSPAGGPTVVRACLPVDPRSPS